MTAEDLEDFDDDECEGLEPRRLSWPYVAGVAATLVGNLTRAVSVACDELAGELARHAEWARRAEDAQEFVQDVTRDLDSIPTVR